MKVICIGNFPPRKCGIATFTLNLTKSILNAAELSNTSINMDIIAMNDGTSHYPYPPEVKRTIRDNAKQDYIGAKNYINNSDADICILQHEYGIFGGNSGLLILELLKEINIPIISTFHTVLDKPNFHQKEVLRKISSYSSKIVIMNSMAIPLLKSIYNVPEEKIHQIEHGVPDFEHFNIKKESPKSWENKTVILTFGLLGRNKGLDTVLRALPQVISKEPNVLYVILGKTHPHVINNAGEEYREYLTHTAKKLKIDKHVEFINEYVTEEDLVYYLHHADIYVTPYLNKEQITSGTLVYAIAGGCAVVSTPYWHAEEVLGKGIGKLFDFKDHNKLAICLNELISNPTQQLKFQQRARNYGREITWIKTGQKYIDVLIEGQKNKITSKQKKQITIPISYDQKTKHFEYLTDDTSIIQHSIGCVPNLKKGYSLDDNARAIIACIYLYQANPDEKYIRLIQKYLAFILYMQREDGTFYNFLSYNRTIEDKIVPDDTFGRVIWALGMLIRYAPTSSLQQNALNIMHSCLNKIDKLRYARGYANTILGLYHYVQKYPDQENFIERIKKLTNKLLEQFNINSDWQWFEPILNYDNGLLPASLFAAFEITGEPKYLEVAFISRKFLETNCLSKGHLSLIGNENWWAKNEKKSQFAQQPIDAMAMVVLYDHAFRATYDLSYIEKITTCHQWFYGLNDLNMPLYNECTQGCNDGIEEYEINHNQGAESILAFLISENIYLKYNKNALKNINQEIETRIKETV